MRVPRVGDIHRRWANKDLFHTDENVISQRFVQGDTRTAALVSSGVIDHLTSACDRRIEHWFYAQAFENDIRRFGVPLRPACADAE